MVNISPADYSVIAPTSSIEVQFTCPSFQTKYAGTKNYTAYFVHFSKSPLRSFEGSFSPTEEVALAPATPVPGTAETCSVFFAEPWTETPDTYYWFVERINCEAKSCAEFSPLSSFAIVKPVPPGGSGKQPAGSTGGVRYLSAYTGCEADKEAEPMNACTVFDTMASFFETNQPVSYKYCVKPPIGKTRCTSKQAAPNTLVIKKIPGKEFGRYRVTWTVEDKVLTRYIRRTR